MGSEIYVSGHNMMSITEMGAVWRNNILKGNTKNSIWHILIVRCLLVIKIVTSHYHLDIGMWISEIEIEIITGK